MTHSSSIDSGGRWPRRPLMTQAQSVPEELTLPPPELLRREENEHYRMAAHLAFLGWTIGVFITNLTPLALIHSPHMNAIKSIIGNSPYGGPLWWAFVIVETLLMPKILAAIFLPHYRLRRPLIYVGSLCGFLAGAAWTAIAGLSYFLDFGMYSFVLTMTAMGNLAFGFTLAYSINHESLREMRYLERLDERR